MPQPIRNRLNQSVGPSRQRQNPLGEIDIADVIATTDGLVAYSGVKVGVNQSAEFTPVASYPGLTADVRARLGDIKVAPMLPDVLASDTPLPDANRNVSLPAAATPKALAARAKRAEAN